MKGKFERYGLVWPDGTTDLQVEFQMIRKGGSLTLPNGKQAGVGLFEHYMNARKLLWPDRYRHRWTDLLYQEFIQNSVTIMMGAGSCVAGHTLLLDPTTGIKTRISDLCFNRVRPVVMTLNGPEVADVPFIRGYDQLFEVTLADGRKFTATGKHRVLGPDGFLCVDALSSGQRLLAYGGFHQSSTPGSGQPARIEDVRNWWKTTPDFQSDCQTDLHSCDEQPRRAPSNGPTPFPSQVGVRKHPCQTSMRKGGREITPLHNHGNTPVFRPSNLGALIHAELLETPSKGHFVSGIAQPLNGSFSQSEQSQTWTRQPQAFEESDRGLVRNVKDLLRMPYSEEFYITPTEVSTITPMGYDFYFDLEVPIAKHYFAEGTIHHNTQKTSHASEFALINYWLYPKETLVILSTTTVSKLEMAVFGEIKMLWQSARDRWGDYLAGNPIDSKHAIATDAVEEGQVRDLRRGVIGLACYVGKQFVGLGTYAGIKQKRVIFVADELQFMAPTFLECLPNMMQGTELLKVIGSGNPKHDPLDQLGRAAEPKAGWESLGDIKKTTVWETKFLNGRCVNLVGTDSPNFDYPEDQPTAFKGLVSWKTVASVAAFWGKDSLEYSKQCLGTMRIGMIGSRVITAALCKQHKAQDRALWESTNRTRIYACDPAWGGINADRCVAGWGEFGIDKDGVQILRVNQPVVVPIIAASSVLPDDQIAHFIRRDTERLSIEPEDIFYDSTGRGTTGSAFARIFGQRVPVPIAFGDRPSRRPVRHDLFVIEPDGTKRLKRCDEYYQKFVTELWFSVRYIIECDQMRELPDDVMMEGTMREYKTVAGGKIEVESKDDTRERMGCSPDLFDWLAILVEGARQRGFKIQRLGVTMTEEEDSHDWMFEEQEAYHDAIKEMLLTH